MKVFSCDVCSQIAFFDNTICVKCSASLGYEPISNHILAREDKKEATFISKTKPEKTYKYCSNQVHHACNWLIPEDSTETLCLACQLNRTIPDINDDTSLVAWRKIEKAKHRLIYNLLRLNLDLESTDEEKTPSLHFDFLSEDPTLEEKSVFTGYANGLITINIAEADSVHREQSKVNLSERYRTLEGHMRHEAGHYYWEKLVQPNKKALLEFRELFGDDRLDYGEALKMYYANGPDVNWRDHFISAYSSSHPFEDWAETWAHYLHCIDTFETLHSFGVSVNPLVKTEPPMDRKADFNPYTSESFEPIFDSCIPLMLAINSVNRSMGQPDLYPFVFPQAALEKLEFIHRLIIQSNVSSTPHILA